MLTLAVQLIDDDGFRTFVLIATVLFIIGAVMAVLDREWVLAFLLAGLACFTLAWVVVS